MQVIGWEEVEEEEGGGGSVTAEGPEGRLAMYGV